MAAPTANLPGFPEWRIGDRDCPNTWPRRVAALLRRLIRILGWPAD